MPLTAKDISTVPPVSKRNEMEEAATLLKRWLLASLLAGLEDEEAESK